MSGFAMRTKADAPCAQCGETVAAGAGHFIKVKGKGWRAKHDFCPVVQRAHDSLDTMALAMLAAIRQQMKPPTD